MGVKMNRIWIQCQKGEPDIMDQPPRPPNERIINRSMMNGIIIQTVAITVVTLVAYLAGLAYYADQPDVATTMAFVTLSFSELLRAFTARSERYPVYRIGIFSNKYMNLAIVTSLALLLLVVYVPFLQPIFNTAALDRPLSNSARATNASFFIEFPSMSEVIVGRSAHA